MAQVAARLLVGVGQAVAILAVGAALGANVAIGATLAWLVPLAAIGALIALNIGFVIAGVTGTPEGAAPLARLLVMPLWLLSGVMLPVEAFPGVVEEAVKYLPPTPLVEVVRGIALRGEGISGFGPELAILGGWLVASFVVATRAFRFAEKAL